jgi:hypothetical protein
MSIERAEQLKREWTDKFVVVNPEVPQLRRFRNLTGTVKTVNMNCRALVQFDGPEDISWYDIDLDHLQVVDAPRKKEPAHAKQAPSEDKPQAAKAPAAKPAGKSPLQLAREQAGGGAKPAEAAPAAKKLSPLELARQQGATKPAANPPRETEEAPASPPPPKTDDGGRKLSPIERARMQDANKKKS